MPVHFSTDRMDEVYEAYRRWWLGELERPLMRITLTDAYPAKPTGIPVLSQENCADFRYSAEEVIDALDRELSRQQYLGDAFPMVNFAAFGPGVLAAFCGARLDNTSGRVWFFPQEELELSQIHVRYDPDNRYAKRIKELYRAGLNKWNGAVLMSLPDLGGVMDVAATFRGSENLLMDLLDEPEEVLRLNQEIQTAWYEAYQDLLAVLKPQKYNTNWSGLMSREPSYILQCDFCYMISNPMFREFVLDTLRRDTEHLPNAIYHLDGIGQLKHLDDVLSLKNLRAVQWVFGDGQPQAEHWMDVYRRIHAAGKQCMLAGLPQNNLEVISQLHGSPYVVHDLPVSELELARQLLTIR